MTIFRRARCVAFATAFASISPLSVEAQRQLPPIASRDTVTIVAKDEFAAGGLKRSLLGDNYRDLWTAPIRVPVLDLRTFAGGLTPLEEGGGAQTRNLRFRRSDGAEYVFRPVVKRSSGSLSKVFDNTIVQDIFRDQASASHPGATVVAPAMLAAVGVLHPVPRLVVMPDDPLLGEFRKNFAGLLGTIEDYPADSTAGQKFGGALKIIDTEELLDRINKSPGDQVDARNLLTARMVDMLLGDNDRHPDQWRWARLTEGPSARWVPIPRDRDKVFISYEGLVLDVARRAVPSMVEFGSEHSNPSALFDNAIEFDRRLLAGLDRGVWDSVAASVVTRVSDAVINTAIRSMPLGYVALSGGLTDMIKARRATLPAVATRYYENLWATTDIHATDDADVTSVVRAADGSVTVRIQSGNDRPWFTRRFAAGETSGIRIYLHGGDDRASVTGTAGSSIPVTIIGGNGTNTILDSSIVGGSANPTELRDSGTVTDVKYARDKAAEEESETAAMNESFNRRPWVAAYGRLIPPQRDRGTSVSPVIGVRTGHGLGIVPKIGLARYTYGFRKVPYSSMVKAELEYSTAIRGFEIGLEGDKRFESSSFHALAEANVSQIKVGEFRGFGNDTPDLRGEFYDVGQTQWLFRPAAGLSFAPEAEVSIGPIIRYTSTDSVNNFISGNRPYGFSSFGQAGLQAKLDYDSRSLVEGAGGRGMEVGGDSDPTLWGKTEFSGAAYPAVWDAESAYQEISGIASSYLTLPVFTRPVLALRAGGKKIFGEFPYFDAAFIGGSSSLRTEHRQRFAGDASLFGTTELRIPLVKFPFILPLNVGALGFVDVGRVYLDGESPGDWNTGAGAGFWVGVVDPGTNVNVLFTNNSDRRVLVNLGFAF